MSRKRFGGLRPPGDYEVGYRKPPQEHRFLKGHKRSGGGRPKGKSDYTQMHGRLMEPVSIKINGREVKLPYMYAAVEVAKANALRGDVKAFQMLMGLAREFGIFDPRADDFSEITHIINFVHTLADGTPVNEDGIPL